MENRLITIWEIPEDVDISVSLCHAIFFGCFDEISFEIARLYLKEAESVKIYTK